MLGGEGYRAKYAILNASDYGVPQARKRLYIVGIREDVVSGEFRFPHPAGKKVSVRDILLPKSKVESTVIVRNDITITDTNFGKDLGARSEKPIQIGVINKGGQGERIYSPEGQGITLSAHGGGAAAKTGAFLVDGVVRKLHPVECRRMMGFPESVKIDPRTGQAYKQFGNAVVASVVEAIGKEMLDAAKLKWEQAVLELK